MKRAFKISGFILLATYLVLLFIHIRLFLFMGRTSIITTLLFYITLTLFSLALVLLLSRFIRYFKSKKKDYILLIIILFSSLFFTELILKYAVKTHQSYLEKNGSFYYHSYYRQVNKENQEYIQGVRKDKVWYKLNYPNFPWIHTTNEFTQVHNINSSGCRDNEFNLNKDTNEYRIIALGDSFTQGVGAPEDSTYPDFLERDLGQLSQRKVISVYNAGNSGSDPFFEFMVLRDKLLDYSPDLIIVALNTSDIEDVILRGGMERFKTDGTVIYRKGPPWEFLYGISYICRHCIHDFLGYNWALIKYEDQEKEFSEAMDLLKVAIDNFHDLSEKANCDLIIVFHPMVWEVENKSFILDTLYKSLRSESDIYSLNLHNYYIERAHLDSSNVYKYYWKIDGHHNSRGYELFARGVAEKIVELQLIK